MMTLDEAIRWEKIKEFPNYSISNTGLVRNDTTGKMKTLRRDKYGYLVCGLYSHQRRKECKIHRLIAEHFIPNPNNKPFINHINGIKDDNRIENLEWCTARENNYHAWNVLDSKKRRQKMAEHARSRVWSDESRKKMSEIAKNRVYTDETIKNMSKARKGKEGNHKSPIVCIETNATYKSITQASEDIGISRTSIHNMLSGLSKSAGGYHFRKVAEQC